MVFLQSVLPLCRAFSSYTGLHCRPLCSAGKTAALKPDQRTRCIYASLWVLWSVAVIEFHLLEHMCSPLGLKDTEFEAIYNFLKDYSNYQNTFYRLFSMKLLLNQFLSYFYQKKKFTFTSKASKPILPTLSVPHIQTKTSENQMSNTGALKKYIWSISTIKVTW